jgi:hypothetical protein
MLINRRVQNMNILWKDKPLYYLTLKINLVFCHKWGQTFDFSLHLNRNSQLSHIWIQRWFLIKRSTCVKRDSKHALMNFRSINGRYLAQL